MSPAAFTRDDFKRISLALAAALAMAAAGAAAVVAARALLQHEQKANRSELSRRNEIGGKLARAREEEQELRQKIARFNDLSARGVIGAEQRLEWVEQIRRIRNARRLLDIQYEIAPQRVLDAAQLPGASGKFDFLASTMTLKMELLHEGDLLGFLADLRAALAAHVRVASCSVARAPAGRGDRPVGARLQADCTIDLVTLREKEGGS